MAALLLGAIGLSAQKIKESHVKRKDRKALEIYDAGLREQERIRKEERQRMKSAYAHAQWNRDLASENWRGSGWMDGEVGEAPPRYEDVVKADTERRRVERVELGSRGLDRRNQRVQLA